jgi:pyroglutamyl-peptidase
MIEGMRILISGFGPFGGRELNPTALLVEALENREIDYPEELAVEAVLLPVTFEDSYLHLRRKIEAFNPDVVIALGQAAGRAAIELEHRAENKIHAEIEDNDGRRPTDQRINELGPEFYLSTLPLQGIEGALAKAGLPVKLSNSAGAFVCNYLFYRLMEENQETLRLCGFIHVPLISEQARDDEPSLPFAELKRGLSVILNYINY